MGDVDEATAPMLREALSSAIAKRPSRLEIDLNGATFLARAGLNELIKVRGACAGEVVLVGATQTVRGLLRVLDAEFDLA
jgi:anti-anti-sigma regulatory factor